MSQDFGLSFVFCLDSKNFGQQNIGSGLSKKITILHTFVCRSYQHAPCSERQTEAYKCLMLLLQRIASATYTKTMGCLNLVVVTGFMQAIC